MGSIELRQRGLGGSGMMTAQHYRLIAQTLKDSKPDIPILPLFYHLKIVEAFVKVLELDNANFKPDQFRKAST